MRFAHLLVLLTLCSVLLGQDRIDRHKGAPIGGVEVISEDCKKVTYKRGRGAPKDIDVALVADVVRGDMPAVLREGRAKLLSGDLTDAEGALQLAQQETEPSWAKEYASFYLGETRRRMGKYREAISAYGQVLAAKANSRFLPATKIGMAKCHAASKAYGEARTLLEGFLKEVTEKQLSRVSELEARQVLGQVLVKEGNHTEAARQFGTVVSEAQNLGTKAEGDEKGRYRRVELLATRDRASALIAAGKLDDAERLLRSFSTSEEDLARAIALIGEGEILLGRGQADRARVRLSEAVVTSPSARTELPRALLLLGKCYLKLAKSGEKDARKMAGTYLENVVQRFAGTDEAAEAQALQKTL